MKVYPSYSLLPPSLRPSVWVIQALAESCTGIWADQACALFADPVGKDSGVSFEMAGTNRTRASDPLEGCSGLLAVMGDALVMNYGAVNRTFLQYVGGFPPKHATGPFDADRFGDIKRPNQNNGAGRFKQSSEQGVCKCSVNLVCRTHSIGAFDNFSPNFDNISSNSAALVWYLPTRKSACALERSDTAPKGRMTLSGSKTSLGRRQ